MGPKKELITIDKIKSISPAKDIKHRKQVAKWDAFANKLTLILMYFLDPILPNDGNKTDGRLASLVYLICLTTAGIVMNITTWLQSDSDVEGVTNDHIDGFLMTCICPALIWILYIFCKQNDRKTVDFISPLPHSHRPLMAGAYVFGAGSCVMDILHIAFYMECSSKLSSMAFSIFKALFIITQILFLKKFANATLHKSQNIRLVLFHILGTNVCIWFRALFSHARLIFNKRPDSRVSANSTLVCDNRQTPMMKIWDSSEPYLYPFTMEYTLIAGGILYTMWSGMRDLNPDPQDIYIYDELAEFNTDPEHKDFVDDSSGYLGSSTPSKDWSHSHSQLALSRSTSTTSLCKSCQDTQDNIRDSYNPSSDPGLLIGLMLSAFLWMAIALFWFDQDSLKALRVYYLYQIVLHSVMCFALWLLLKALLIQRSVWYPYNPDDTLLIVSFAGVFLYTGLSFTAALAETQTQSLLSKYSAVKSLLVLLEAMLQVTAVIKAMRFRPNITSNTQSDLVRQGALFLLTTNLALWAQDSFYELRHSETTPVQNKLFGVLTWHAITIFAYPLCIFFRFHSAACLFEVWSSFRQQC